MQPEKLKILADKYESRSFLDGDPSSFMHECGPVREKEVVAFVASALSFGSRKAFMGKIRFILSSAKGNLYGWIKSGAFAEAFRPDDETSFYRFYSHGDMHRFFWVCRQMLEEYSTFGNFVDEKVKDRNALTAIAAFSDYFNRDGGSALIPKATSACKRLCMFLRWMVRDRSPVDIGVWADKIDRSTLIVPLDVHVLRQAAKLELINSKPSASMNLALKLTRKMLEIFPDDPCKGDFALFGLGIEEKSP